MEGSKVNLIYKEVFPNEGNEDFEIRAKCAKNFIIAKDDLNKAIVKLGDKLLKRYNILTNNNLSIGVRKLMLKQIK